MWGDRAIVCCRISRGPSGTCCAATTGSGSGPPGVGARGLSSPDRCGVTVDLHDEKVRLGGLSDVVHTYAPGVPVWDAGKVKSENVRIEGR